MAKQSILNDKFNMIDTAMASASEHLHIFYDYLNSKRMKFTPRNVYNYEWDDLFLSCSIMPLLRNKWAIEWVWVGSEALIDERTDDEKMLDMLSKMKGANIILSLSQIKSVAFIPNTVDSQAILEFEVYYCELWGKVGINRIRIDTDRFIYVTDMRVAPQSVESLIS